MIKVVFSVLLFAAVIFGVIKWIKYGKEEDQVIDTIVIFSDKEIGTKFISDKKVLSIADWQKYGEKGFRGFSKLNKEDLAELLTTRLEISPEKFEISNPSDLYMASTLLR